MTCMTPETPGEAPRSHICFFWKSKRHSQMKDMTPETPGEAPKSHICFFWKKQMSLTDDRHDSINTSRGPMRLLEPLLVFLESYLSSVSDICFFQKKQMWLIGASPCVSGVISVMSEWHLLFPEKANVTPWGLSLCFWSHVCHLRVAFAFSRKSKCDS